MSAESPTKRQKVEQVEADEEEDGQIDSWIFSCVADMSLADLASMFDLEQGATQLQVDSRRWASVQVRPNDSAAPLRASLPMSALLHPVGLSRCLRCS